MTAPDDLLPASPDARTYVLRAIAGEHQTLEAMLRSMPLLVQQRRRSDIPPNFSALRAILCYVSEQPDRHHHPKEDRWLFPVLKACHPRLGAEFDALTADHVAAEARWGRLDRALTAWEWMGDSRRAAFSRELDDYVAFYLGHMRREERLLAPAMTSGLNPADWQTIAHGFAHEPAAPGGVTDAPVFDALFETILSVSPAPYGFAPA